MSTDIILENDYGTTIRIGSKCFQRLSRPLTDKNITHTSALFDKTFEDECESCQENLLESSIEFASILSGSMNLSNPVDTDEFGFSVAHISDTIAVGAPGQSLSVTKIEDEELSGIVFPDGDRTGVAYVFRKSGSDFVEEQILSGRFSTPGSRFGHSVAVSERLVFVGAPMADVVGIPDAGTVSVFEYNRQRLKWEEIQTIVGSLASTNDQFGYSIDVSNTTLVVGAYKEDPTKLYDAGVAYVFDRHPVSGLWNQTQILSSSVPSFQGYFGVSVSIDEDQIVVGEPQAEVSGFFDGGLVHIFEKNDENVWILAQTISSPNLEENSRFGHKVSLTKDRLVVSSSGEKRIYVFDRDPNTGSWNIRQHTFSSCLSPDSFSVYKNKIVIGYPESTNVDYSISDGWFWNLYAIIIPPSSNWDLNSFGDFVYVDSDVMLLSSISSQHNDIDHDLGTVTIFELENI